MTSMLCMKTEGGTVKVHDNNVVEQLVSDGEHHTQEMFQTKDRTLPKSCNKRPATMPSLNSGRSLDSRNKVNRYLKTQDWLNEKTVKSLQDKADAETKDTRRLYSPLLETEDTFVRDVDDYLMRKYINDLRKKEILHKNWNDKVFEPIRGRIINAMGCSNWPELDRRKRELHKQYLEFINDKGHIFLDTLDPREYYAQALNGSRPSPIAIKTSYLRDPLLSQQRERKDEEKTILRCLTGQTHTDKDIDSIKLPPLPLVPLGRHGTDSTTWLSMPLHNIDSTPRRSSMARMKGRCTNSIIDFSVWAKERYGISQVDEEMQIQRKRMYSEDEKPPYMYRHKRYVSVDKNDDMNEHLNEEVPSVMTSGSVIVSCDA